MELVQLQICVRVQMDMQEIIANFISALEVFPIKQMFVTDKDLALAQMYAFATQNMEEMNANIQFATQNYPQIQQMFVVEMGLVLLQMFAIVQVVIMETIVKFLIALENSPILLMFVNPMENALVSNIVPAIKGTLVTTVSSTFVKERHQMIHQFAHPMEVVFPLMFAHVLVVGKEVYVIYSLVKIEIPARHMEPALDQTIVRVFLLLEDKIALFLNVLVYCQQTQKFVHLMEFVTHLINVHALLQGIQGPFAITQFAQW
jgi:hypothetical protein